MCFVFVSRTAWEVWYAGVNVYVCFCVIPASMKSSEAPRQKAQVGPVFYLSTQLTSSA